MDKTRAFWPMILLTGLSMSVGWGVRGQFGHEYGAALAGALGAMAVALLSGREDWRRRMLGTGSRVAGVLLAAQSDRSVLEQTRGLWHGVALSITMALILRRAPKVSDDPPVRRWTEAYSVVFVLWLLTYLNFRKSPDHGLAYIKSMPEQMYGIYGVANFLPSRGFLGWFDLAFLWTTTFINFAGVLPRFAPQRLVTEWFITYKQAVRVGEWKGVRVAARSPLEVYHLREDPGETRNGAAQAPEVVARLEKVMAAARRESPDYPIRELGRP